MSSSMALSSGKVPQPFPEPLGTTSQPSMERMRPKPSLHLELKGVLSGTTNGLQLTSLPVDILMHIISFLSYLDRYNLKLSGHHGLRWFLHGLPKLSYGDYLKKLPIVDGPTRCEGRDVWAVLWFACTRGHDAVLLKTLNDDILAPGSRFILTPAGMLSGRRVLHLCLESAVLITKVSIPTVRLLLELGARNLEVALKGSIHGRNALEVAASKGNNELITILLNADARIHYPQRRPCATDLAARHGHLHSLQLLLETAQDTSEEISSSALHEAARHGRFEALSYLLQRGVPAVPEDGHISPLHSAARSGNVECYQLLLEYGAVDPPIDHYNESTRIHHRNWTSLHVAAECGHLELIQYILSKGLVGPDVEDKHEAVLAVASKRQRLDGRIASLLVEAGFNIHGRYSGPNDDTALHLAATNDHINLVAFLLSKGADPNIHGGKDHSTPLHRAVNTGGMHGIQLLLSNGAEVNAVNSSGDTPLHVALQKGRRTIVQILLEFGADPRRANKLGKTPLSIVTDEKSTRLIRLMTEIQERKM